MTFISYAQNFEDVMLWRALKDIDNGFYVDVGANDPVFFSVTQAFYERGWRGINLEPMRSYYERLYIARPLDINLPFAAADQEGELVFYEIPETGLSTIDKAVAEQERQAGWTVKEENVQAFTLNQIFEKYVNTPIHFLKIDVEGAEESVLQGLDLAHWRPWILIVEATVPLSQELCYESWEPLLVAANYDMVYFDGLNRFYIASEHSELANSFKTPPNIFDEFILFQHKSTLEDRDRIVEDRSRILEDRDRILEDRNHILEDRNRILEDRNRIADELNRVTANRDLILTELMNIYDSRSWRMTAPLRKLIDSEAGQTIIDILSRLFPLGTLPKRATLKISRLSRESLQGIANILSRLFPLSTLPQRATLKITRLSRAGGHKIINTWKEFRHKPAQEAAYSLVGEEYVPMSSQVRAIYLDLVNSISETKANITNKVKRIE